MKKMLLCASNVDFYPLHYCWVLFNSVKFKVCFLPFADFDTSFSNSCQFVYIEDRALQLNANKSPFFTDEGHAGCFYMRSVIIVDMKFLRVLFLWEVARYILPFSWTFISEILDPYDHCGFFCGDSSLSYCCDCGTGYDLFTENGTNGFYIPSEETGLRDLDVYHINITCVR